MTSTVAPTIYSETWPTTQTSVAFPIPLVDYDHVLAVADRAVWVKPGGADVVAVPQAADCVYLPANTLLEVPTRRYQVEGITHIAVILAGPGQSGFINWNFGNQVVTETDLLMNIHSCLMHMLTLHAGEPTHPHYPLEQKTHIDVTE